MLHEGYSLETSPHERLVRRRFVIICMCFGLLCLALKPMTWFAPRAEGDEQIYWTLARGLYHSGHYSLQGTGAIEALGLSRHIYDRPIFHHPPLYPVLLLPFVAARNPNAAIVVSWFGHVLAIAGVGFACWAWRRPSWRGTELVLWLPVLAVAVDPLLMFCSRKLWLDSLVGGLDALGLGLTAMAVHRQRLSWFIAVGVAFGLAGLSKLTGLVPLLPALIWAFVALRAQPGRARMLLALVTPVVIMVLPWLLLFRVKAGAWFPNWVAPTPESIAASSHVARAIERSSYYYIVQSVMIAPIVLACAVRLARPGGGGVMRRWMLGAGTVILVGVAMTVLGIRGMGMQMRYLAPGVGGLYVLLAAQLVGVDSRRSLFPAVVLACVLFGCIQTGFYLQAVEFDEMVSFPEVVWKVLTGAARGIGGGGE